MNKSLDTILPDHDLPADIRINGIARDSRKVKSGNLFVAVPGIEDDGRLYIEEAIAKNAAAVIYEKEWSSLPQSEAIPVIGVNDLGSKIGGMASRFYDRPSADLRIVAVTGTNGKTSCSHFIACALNFLGVKCGIVGTLGSGFSDTLVNPGLTTPEAIELQKIFSELKKNNAKAVALEASSHGLDQGRLDGTNVDIAVLTNISRDHLDYHPDFDHYKESKSRLFLRTGLSGMVLNIDDELGKELDNRLKGVMGLLTYSRNDSSADIVAEKFYFNEDGISFELRTPEGKTAVSSSLVGDFNLSNLLALAGVLYLLRFGVDQIGIALSSVKGVRGRMDVIHKQNFPTVVIDYAHTPDALDKALLASRNHCKGKLICVFGCGGDRDKGKRVEMGKIAAKGADIVVITDDNPRTEPSGSIIQDILMGIEDRRSVTIESQRRVAIEMAIGQANAADWVLIAGKGHETYQEIMGKKISYSDYEVVSDLMKEGAKES